MAKTQAEIKNAYAKKATMMLDYKLKKAQSRLCRTLPNKRD